MRDTASKTILFSPPSIGSAEIDKVVEVMRSGWLTTGPVTAEFEETFRDFVGAEASLAVNSCTSALTLALHTLGVGEGDEVITTCNTFVSTVNVIEHCGARPVLVDVEPDTMNLDPRLVESRIGERTKAVVAVHFAGHPVDLSSLQAICDKHGVALIEDAAHAIPAEYEGRRIGGTGNLTAFSFYATKNLTTGEGGMLTGPSGLIDRARSLSLHGMSRNAWKRYGESGRWGYDVIAPGFKFNMSDLQAALGVVQLRRLPELQEKRRRVFERYNEAFQAHDGLETPVARANIGHAWHLYVLRLSRDATMSRDEMFDYLYNLGIRPSLHFIPIYRHSCYREKYALEPNDFPVAEDAFARMLSLPLSPALADAEVDRVCEGVLSCLDVRQRGAA